MDSRILYLLAIVAVIGSAAIADTWRIDGQGEMESLSDEPQSRGTSNSPGHMDARCPDEPPRGR